MSKKKLQIFAITLISFVVIMIIIIKLNEKSMYNSILESSPEQYDNVRFYKDYLRDDGDLDLFLTDKKDISDFVSALKTMKSTSFQIKTLENIVWYKLQFNLNQPEKKVFTIMIHRSDQSGDTGVISINEGETFQTSGGTYESKELLKWAENMQIKKGFENIKGTY